MNNIHAFLTHPVVQALGWTLLHFLWQGTAVAILLAVALLTLRRASANARYLAACIALLLMVSAPVATFVYLVPEAPMPASASLSDLPELPELPDVVAEGRPTMSGIVAPLLVEAPEPIVATPPPLPPEPQAWHVRALDWTEAHLAWFVGGWIVGVLILSVRLAFGWLGIRRMRHSGNPADESTTHRMKRLAERLRVSRTVRLLVSGIARAPVVVGWMRPAILLPASILSGLSAEQLDAILAHELAHIRRHDYLINLIQTVVETVLFYHPAVHWVSRRMRVEREHCCDDLAVRVCGDKAVYARALARLAEMNAPAPRLVPAAGGELFTRIRRLLAPRAKEHGSVSRWLAGGLVLAALVIAVVSFGALAQAEEPEKADVGGNDAEGMEPAAQDADTVEKAETGAKVPNYSDMLGVTGPDAEYRMPTTEEIKMLGPLWPSVPASENAAYYFYKANVDRRQNTKDNPEPAGSASSEILYAGDVAAFVTYVDENARSLENIKIGLQQKVCEAPSYINVANNTPLTGSPVLAEFRNAARFVSDAGFAAELRDRPWAAAQHYMDIMRMGSMIQQNGTMITMLVGLAVENTGADNMSSLIGHGAFNENGLRGIIKTARDVESTTESRLNMLRKEKAYQSILIATQPGMTVVYAPSFEPYSAAIEEEYKKPLSELIRTGEARAIALAEQYPVWKEAVLPVLTSLPVKLGQQDLTLRALQVRAAIALFQKQNNGLIPDRLEELVPAILPEVPVDPFSGKSLLYRRDGEKWKVWSVGQDSVDNGGEVPPLEPLQSRVYWHRPDYVFISDLPANIEYRSKGQLQLRPAAAPRNVDEYTSAVIEAINANIPDTVELQGLKWITNDYVNAKPGRMYLLTAAKTDAQFKEALLQGLKGTLVGGVPVVTHVNVGRARETTAEANMPGTAETLSVEVFIELLDYDAFMKTVKSLNPGRVLDEGQERLVGVGNAEWYLQTEREFSNYLKQREDPNAFPKSPSDLIVPAARGPGSMLNELLRGLSSERLGRMLAQILASRQPIDIGQIIDSDLETVKTPPDEFAATFMNLTSNKDQQLYLKQLQNDQPRFYDFVMSVRNIRTRESILRMQSQGVSMEARWTAKPLGQFEFDRWNRTKLAQFICAVAVIESESQYKEILKEYYSAAIVNAVRSTIPEGAEVQGIEWMNAGDVTGGKDERLYLIIQAQTDAGQEAALFQEKLLQTLKGVRIAGVPVVAGVWGWPSSIVDEKKVPAGAKKLTAAIMAEIIDYDTFSTKPPAAAAETLKPALITNESFQEWLSACSALTSGKPRDEVAALFQKVHDEFPDTAQGKDSAELAGMLRKMHEEDLAFKEPADVNALTEKERIQYYIFKLRDVHAVSREVPGMLHVWWPHPVEEVLALRKIGKPAMPELIALLEDRRPIRSAENPMNGGGLIRYSDAALQIIEIISMQIFDTRGFQRGRRLTNGDKATQALIIANVKKWWEENKDKSEAEWIRVGLSEETTWSASYLQMAKERLEELEVAQSTATDK